MPPFAASLFDAVVIKSAEALNYVRGLNTVGAAYIQQPPTCGFDNIGALLPDARSIVVTQRRKEVTHEWATREWDMCKDNHSCKHEEAQGHIVFGFPADSLVVEFTGPQGYDHVSYSDIDILVERPGPETIPSPHFTLRGGVCHQYQSGFRCGIPFKAIGPDRLGGMCTSAGHGLSTFDVKIEAVASIGSKEFRFFGRSSTGSFGWFSLSYTCTKCQAEEATEQSKKLQAARVGYSKPNEAHNDFINAKKRDTAQLAANPECEKKFISAFGRGKRAFHFSELPWDPQQTACQQDGYYHKYSIQDLQQAASGALIDGDREAGHFAIRRSMSSGRATISLDIAMQDQHYTIKEASLFIDCTSGIDDSIYDPSIASYEPSICKLESHPYRQTIKPYIGSAHFDIRDTLSCRNGYYVVIHAIICSKDVWGPRCYERETQC